MKKITFLLSTLSACLLIASVSYAASPLPTPPAGATAKDIRAAVAAAQTATNNMVYQYDNNLPGIVSSDSSSNTARNNASAAALAATDAYINAIVMQPMVSVYSSLKTPESPSNVLNSVTTKLPGNDELHLLTGNSPTANPFGAAEAAAKAAAEAAANKSSLANLNFASLLGPEAYSSKQTAAAANFTKLISKSYTPIIPSSLNLKGIQGMSSKEVQQLANNPTYLKFLADVRSAAASYSVGISNLQHLIAERTPTSTLNGTVPGVSNPSPLEVEAYRATHRINNKQWFASMESASPATVQRETLFTEAEIENELYTNHLDNERILGTLSAIQLSLAHLGNTQLQLEAKGVNALLKGNNNKVTAKLLQQNALTTAQAKKEMAARKKAREESKANQGKDSKKHKKDD